MKRLLAILALTIIAMSWPLAASAGQASSDADMQAPAGSQGLEIPTPPHHLEGLEQDQQDANGDPHDLGGGFRGTGSVMGGGGLVPVWIGPVATLIMQLI
ncbi:MAG: hypothetical protein R3D98_08615 [Candidatus Krumholzibacteriia bacterium]